MILPPGGGQVRSGQVPDLTWAAAKGTCRREPCSNSKPGAVGLVRNPVSQVHQRGPPPGGRRRACLRSETDRGAWCKIDRHMLPAHPTAHLPFSAIRQLLLPTTCRPFIGAVCHGRRYLDLCACLIRRSVHGSGTLQSEGEARLGSQSRGKIRVEQRTVVSSVALLGRLIWEG